MSYCCQPMHEAYSFEVPVGEDILSIKVTSTELTLIFCSFVLVA